MQPVNRLTSGGLTLDQRNQLIEENLRVADIVTRYWKYRKCSEILGFEEARSIALLELVKRAESFDPKKSLNFPAYAFRSLGNRIVHEAVRKRPTPTDPQKSQVVGREMQPDWYAVLNEEVRQAKRTTLTPAKIRAMRMRHARGESVNSIANRYGISWKIAAKLISGRTYYRGEDLQPSQ